MDWRTPEHEEAVRREQLTRDAAFLGLTESIGNDFEVVPITLRQLLILRLARSPFISGHAPGCALDILLFLWLLHPDYCPEGGLSKERLKQACAKFAVPRKPWLHTRRAMNRWRERSEAVLLRVAKITGEIRAYLDEAMADWPAGTDNAGASYYSDACAVCAQLAREHHRSQEWVMDQPLKVVFQYLNEIRSRAGKPLFNKSDDYKHRWLLENQPADSVIGKLLAKKRN